MSEKKSDIGWCCTKVQI